MRSGHTLVGQLLNAHPNIVISHELGALSLLAKGYSISQLFYLCIQKDEEFKRQNREWTGYKYKVEGQYQGRYSNLRVVGDKNGAATVYDFVHNTNLFKVLEEMNVRVRVIHHTRNPFDVITTGLRKGEEMSDLNEVSSYFIRQATKVQNIIESLEKIDGVSVKTTHHEDLIEESKSTMKALVNFLGEDASASYLESCADLIFDEHKRTRGEVSWTDSQIRKLEEQIEEHRYLPNYKFEVSV
jgi:hypothetical protein